MNQRKALLTLFLTGGIIANTAQANIIYSVDRTIGEGSVTGSITTDGTLGDLYTVIDTSSGGRESYRVKSHIIDWNLLLNDGTNSFTIDRSNSDLAGSDETSRTGSNNFWASPRKLFFDFTTGWAQFHYGNPFTLGYVSAWWGLNNGNMRGETVYAGPHEMDENFSYPVFEAQEQFQPQFRRVIVGSVHASIPEPSSLVLLSLGLAAVVYTRKLKTD